jgi:hypothetical protein
MEQKSINENRRPILSLIKAAAIAPKKQPAVRRDTTLELQEAISIQVFTTYSQINSRNLRIAAGAESRLVGWKTEVLFEAFECKHTTHHTGIITCTR